MWDDLPAGIEMPTVFVDESWLLVDENDYVETESNTCTNRSLILQIKGHGESNHVTITSFPCIIGRSEKSDIRLCDKFVSRKHIVIDKIDNFIYTVMDLESSNKTFLNQSELIPNRPYVIKKGDIINISDYSINIITFLGVF